MTLHSAKGLEFDTVFLVGMEEGLFPHSQSMGSQEDLEEERRLCYVGITRARQKLYLTWTPFRRRFGPDSDSAALASRFLNEMPQELLEGFEDERYDGPYQKARMRDRFRESAAEYKTERGARIDKGRDEPLPQPKSIAELRAYIAQKQRSGGTGKLDAKDKPIIKAGMRVRHEQFGDGIVLSRERAGNEIKLVVTFSRVGRKSLIERYAKLKAL
jgi:DNA helicase-2/ATP-dependent DNA helicase PcrA